MPQVSTYDVRGNDSEEKRVSQSDFSSTGAGLRIPVCSSRLMVRGMAVQGGDNSVSKQSSYQIGGAHYIGLDIQPWDVMEAWFPNSFPDHLLMTALKYIQRDKINKVEDIRKARHYLDKWLEVQTRDRIQPDTPTQEQGKEFP